jgi:hypothetical protein
MASFHAARYGEAAAAFARFGGACSADRRAEDAAYLEVVALARAGRTAEARSAAQAYLSKFPHGFRRQESERFLGGATPAP